MPDYFYVRVCSECGKQFIAELNHAWRVGNGYRSKPVCSYGCQRKYEKRHNLLRMGENRNIELVCARLGCEE